MHNSNSDPLKPGYIVTAIEITIRLAVLVGLIGWCLLIMLPFLSLIIWSVIIAIATYPVFSVLSKKLGGRDKLAATIITLFFLALILVPFAFLADSLFEGIGNLREIYQSGNFSIPPPGEEVKSWPAFTKPVVDAWRLASVNLSDAIIKFNPEIKAFGGWLLSVVAGTGKGILLFAGSLIVSGIILCYSKEGGEMMKKVFIKLTGEQGETYAEISKMTIRNVVKGILGVAVIQTLLAGIGLIVAGVPYAGLWILFCLIFAMIQLGVGPILIPAIIYMFATSDTLSAILFLGWSIIVMASDNVLKPILLGKGAPVPMLVVFLGSLGGFIASGFIGLFIGPVILTLGYLLFQSWMKVRAQQEADKTNQPELPG
jgi:predicted PurR-regulated permease PerM